MVKKEYSFSFDINKCVACHACETACKVHNNIEAGGTWRHIKTLWHGNYPEISSINISISCMHCIDPECMKICPEEAISKDTNGIVSVDQEMCSGCRLCFDACPVKAPQFGENTKMQKCNFCIQVIEKGYNPVCIATCPGGAIYFEIVDKSLKIRFEKEMVEYFT